MHSTAIIGAHVTRERAGWRSMGGKGTGWAAFRWGQECLHTIRGCRFASEMKAIGKS